MKKIIPLAIFIIVIALGVYFLTTKEPEIIENIDNQTSTSTDQSSTTTSQEQNQSEDQKEVVIGTSAGGKSITLYNYGNGDTNVLFVGGIHGGYEWNTSLLAYQLMDHLESNPDAIPDNVKVSVIPVLNPDGLEKVTGKTGRFEASDVSKSNEVLVSGRFNGNNVDLNRNFDCDWQANGTWQNKTVSGGSSAFSEPESKAIRDYVNGNKPDAVVVWYSAAGGVFSSSCHNGVLPETNELTNLFAKASGYPAHEEFNFYEITGDMVNWFAKNNIPAISVLLTNHTDTEWNKNRAGIEAILKHYEN